MSAGSELVIMQERVSVVRSPGAATQALGYFRDLGEASRGKLRTAQEQERAFAAFCQRMGYVPCGQLMETGDSRAQYGTLLRMLERGEGSLVLVAGADVFGAEQEDAAMAVLEVESLGARVQVIDGGMVELMGLLASATVRGVRQGQDIRDRIKAGMRSRAIRGEGLGKPPYGYRIGASKRLEMETDEAETVRLIYSLYTQRNKGIRLVVRHLNEQKIPTRKGRNWSMVTIRDILRNRAYLGTYTRFGMRVPGSHLAIITPEQFRWVQQRMDQRKPKRSMTQAAPYLLSGMVFCGACGNRMVGVTRKQSWTRRKDGTKAQKQYRYYQCQSRTNQGVCSYHTRRAADLEMSMLDFLQKQRAKIVAIKNKRASASPQAVKREMQKAEVELLGLERKLRLRLRQAASGKLNAQQLGPVTLPLLRTRRELAERLTGLRNGASGQATNGAEEEVGQTIDRLSQEWETMLLGEKRAVLEDMVERVTVFDDRSEVELRKA